MPLFHASSSFSALMVRSRRRSIRHRPTGVEDPWKWASHWRRPWLQTRRPISRVWQAVRSWGSRLPWSSWTEVSRTCGCMWGSYTRTEAWLRPPKIDYGAHQKGLNEFNRSKYDPSRATSLLDKNKTRVLHRNAGVYRHWIHGGPTGTFAFSG